MTLVEDSVHAVYICFQTKMKKDVNIGILNEAFEISQQNKDEERRSAKQYKQSKNVTRKQKELNIQA